MSGESQRTSGEVGQRAGRVIGEISDRLNPPADLRPSCQQQQWWSAVDEAHREWMDAEAYFQNVSDPELVDHAIHLLAAAEKKYAYLLSQVRRELKEG
ncbi:MAG: DUF2508 family protein [Bacillota bacterium]